MKLLVIACSVCFQVEHNATTDGLRAAVVVLIAVTVCVLIGFAAFIHRLARSAALESHGTPEPQNAGTPEPGTPESQNLGTPEPWRLPSQS